MKSKILTISINSNPQSVYEFVSNLENLPKWAKTFCRSTPFLKNIKDGAILAMKYFSKERKVKKSNGEWIIETPQGPMGIRITPKNDFGILDHTVTEPQRGNGGSLRRDEGQHHDPCPGRGSVRSHARCPK